MMLSALVNRLRLREVFVITVRVSQSECMASDWEQDFPVAGAIRRCGAPLTCRGLYRRFEHSPRSHP